MTAAIPRHLFQDDGHPADVGESGEGQAQANESAEKDPERIDGECQDDASQRQHTCSQAYLAFKRPARLPAGHDGKARFEPCFRAALKNCNLPLARLEQPGSHASAVAGLADENNGKIEVEIVKAAFDLIHRNVDGARDVAGSEFRTGTHVYELGWGGWVASELRHGYGRAQNSLLRREEREFWEKDSGRARETKVPRRARDDKGLGDEAGS